MQLNKPQYSALCSFIRSLSMGQFNAQHRGAVLGLDPNGAHKHLKAIAPETLQQLLNVLPSGKVAKITSPVLKSIRHAVKQDLLYVRRPHLDKDHWPKIIRRQTKMNNARAGLFAGPGGMTLKLHDKGMSVPLRGTHRWNDKNGGELILMGHWYEIMAEIGKAIGGVRLVSELDGMANDVNAEFDRKYGSMPGDDQRGVEAVWTMPFYISYESGPQFECVGEEGETVLDPRGDIVRLVGSKVAGVAGNIDAPLDFAAYGRTGLDVVGVVVDSVQKARDEWKSRTVDDGPPDGGRTDQQMDKTIYTIVIGTAAVGGRYISTDKTVLDGNDLMKFTLQALQNA